jgi:hypothetical protein
MRVTDVAVTANARHFLDFLFFVRNRNGLDHLLMTVAARLLGDFQIVSFDLNRLVKAAGREIVGMPETVRGFRGVFADKIVRRVTIVAGGDGVMARFLPAVVLFLHYVTVGAGRRIVAHIRVTFGVNECVNADSDGQPDRDAEHDQFDGLQFHPKFFTPLENL